jgi:hypothetical protein
MTRVVPKIAQAVPLNAEDERLVDAMVARKMADMHTRPLRRKTLDSMRRVLYVIGVLAVIILGTAILVWSAFFPHR